MIRRRHRERSRWKHIAAVAAVAVALVTGPSVAGSPAASRTYIVETVRARWLFPEKLNFYEYWDFQAVRRSSGSSETVKASLTHGTCRETRDGRGLRCRGDRGAWRPRVTDFSFDRVLRTAYVKFTFSGQDAVISWRGLPATTQPYREEEACPRGSGTSRGLHRYAEARGRIGGRRLPARSSSWNRAWLAAGAAVTDCG